MFYLGLYNISWYNLQYIYIYLKHVLKSSMMCRFQNVNPSYVHPRNSYGFVYYTSNIVPHNHNMTFTKNKPVEELILKYFKIL